MITLESTGEPKAKRTRMRWIVLAILAVTYLLGGADRANLAVALPYIKRDFNLTNAEAGAAASIFFLGVTLVQIPGALLMQKIRVRAVMVGAILLTSLATLLTGFANSATHLLLVRSLLGVAEGPLPVGGLTMISRWFPPRERATAVGIYTASFKTAPALVPPIAAAIIYAFGWREVFFFFAAPGLLIAMLWYFSNDNPRASRRTSPEEVDYIESEGASAANDKRYSRERPLLDRFIRARRVNPLSSNSEVIRSANLWGCALGYSLMSGLTYAILTWVPTYLVEVKNFGLMQMGFVASSPWIGAVLGAIVGGILSDRAFGQRRKPVMMITAGSTILTMYGLISAPNNQFALSGLLFVTGFLLNIGFSTFGVYPMGLAAKEKAPLAIAIVNTMGALGAGTSPVVVGFILDHSGWNAAFTFLSGCSILAFILVAVIIEPRRGGA